MSILSTVVLIPLLPAKKRTKPRHGFFKKVNIGTSVKDVGPSMCFGPQGLQVELLWLGAIRVPSPHLLPHPTARASREFPPGVLLLNNPGHTIAGKLIRADERTEEEMREGWGQICTQTSECKRSFLFFFIPVLPCCLPLLPSVPLSLTFRLNGCLIRAVITLIWCRAISTLCPSSSPVLPSLHPSTLQ